MGEKRKRVEIENGLAEVYPLHKEALTRNGSTNNRTAVIPGTNNGVSAMDLETIVGYHGLDNYATMPDGSRVNAAWQYHMDTQTWEFIDNSNHYGFLIVQEYENPRCTGGE